MRISDLARIVGIKASLKEYISEQRQNVVRLTSIERGYAGGWSCWGSVREIRELLSMSRDNMIRTNRISMVLADEMTPEMRERLRMGTNAYYEQAQSWATNPLPSSLQGVIRDIELWRVPVVTGVQRACSVIAPSDPVRWRSRVGLLNHALLLDRWIRNLDEHGGLDGSELRQFAVLVREYHIGAVASVAMYSKHGLGEFGLPGGERTGKAKNDGWPAHAAA